MADEGDSRPVPLPLGRIHRRRATALTYSGSGAPRVVATGADRIADAIVEIAREAGVPIRRDEALAEALAALEIGTEIPPALYQVVAEALVWALGLERAARSTRTAARR
jgi:flagellar biosynthesis protein